MPKYRRYYIPNSIVFITCATFKRKPIFKDEDNLNLLMTTVKNVKAIHPFELISFSFLPDHIHLLIQMQEDDHDFSKIVKSIKGNFTGNYKKSKIFPKKQHCGRRDFGIISFEMKKIFEITLITSIGIQ